MFKKVTQILIIVLTIGLILYDVAAAIWGGGQATISFQIWDWSAAHPFLPFLAGFLCGHLFFQR